MPVSYGKGDRAKATKLHSQIVRQLGYCQRCGDTAGPHDASHIVRRTYAHTRTDLENAWCLCKPCHYQVDNFADDFMELIDRTIGRARYSYLKAKANNGVRKKFDWAVELERLKELA